MPNTTPSVDHRGAVDFVHQESQRLGLASVKPIGAITKDRQGRELTDFGELFDAGCVALSDDGSAVADGFLMRRALEYAKVFDRPLIQHAEDPSLAANGVMHEGLVSTTLGLRGIPGEAESIMVSRDLALAELTGGRIHFAHLSSAKSVELIRQAKRRGVRVTGEVTPHHLALTDEAVGGFLTEAKVNPPLRTEADRQALIEGLRDGTIDCIATDHAPHTDWEKSADFDSAPFGISGLETALGVCVATLIGPGALSWSQLVEKLSTNPARIIGARSGALSLGADADITVIDPRASWVVDPQRFVSKGKHSPFAGWKLTGVVTNVFVRGAEVSHHE
jgi:dihydroorotase